MGSKLHQNDGVWWLQVTPFICRPAIRHERIHTGHARPCLRQSLLGYSHLTTNACTSNSTRAIVGMARTSTKPFTLDELSSRRRSTIRRGMKVTDIKCIADLNPYKDDIQSILISNRDRTLVGLPSSYYMQHFNDWWRKALILFSMKDRLWWGAFVDERLIAYFHTTCIEDRLLIGAAKSHSDYLNRNPNDVLLYNVMDYAFNKMQCNFIDYGGWSPSDDKLMYFKQSYGFKKIDLPQYVHIRCYAKPALLARSLIRKRRESHAK